MISEVRGFIRIIDEATGVVAPVRVAVPVPGTDAGLYVHVVSTPTGTGNVTVVQPTGANLHVVVDSGSVDATLQGVSSTSDAGAIDTLLEILEELRAMNAENGVFTDHV